MAQDKILTLLGFCRKAGKLVFGTEKVTELIKKGSPCLVMLSKDISPKTEKELTFIPYFAFANRGETEMLVCINY